MSLFIPNIILQWQLFNVQLTFPSGSLLLLWLQLPNARTRWLCHTDI